MITHSTPWQAIVNPANISAVIPTQNNLAVAKKNTSSAKPYPKLKAVNPKRYSFDDNGGGYQGL